MSLPTFQVEELKTGNWPSPQSWVVEPGSQLTWPSLSSPDGPVRARHTCGHHSQFSFMTKSWKGILKQNLKNPKYKSQEKKRDKFDNITGTVSFPRKYNTVTRRITGWRKPFAVSKDNKGHISRLYKALLQINKEKIVTLPEKWSKDKSQQSMEEETPKTNKNVKQCSISLLLREKLRAACHLASLYSKN